MLYRSNESQAHQKETLMIQIFVILIVLGVGLWLVNTYIPMDAKIKNILNIVVVVAVCLWLLSLFFPGLWSSANIPIRGVGR